MTIQKQLYVCKYIWTVVSQALITLCRRVSISAMLAEHLAHRQARAWAGSCCSLSRSTPSSLKITNNHCTWVLAQSWFLLQWFTLTYNLHPYWSLYNINFSVNMLIFASFHSVWFDSKSISFTKRSPIKVDKLSAICIKTKILSRIGFHAFYTKN